MIDIDITGQKFGSFTALERDISKKYKTKSNQCYWLFKCKCGKIKSLTKHRVVRGLTTHCGCSRKRKFNIGDTIKNVVIIEFNKERKYPSFKYKCNLCGQQKMAWDAVLYNQKSICNCLSIQKRKSINGILITDWAKELGLTRQRVHQLYNARRLEDRIKKSAVSG